MNEWIKKKESLWISVCLGVHVQLKRHINQPDRRKNNKVDRWREKDSNRKRERRIADANAEEQLAAGDRQRTDTPQEVQVK